MFKKLEIANVGRFKSVKITEDESQFRKNTFIYGKNTFGKSTLTAIFRSLKHANSDYLVGRKTLKGGNQLVKIFPEKASPVGEYRFTTEEGQWNAEYKDITIFDSHFVRESVYTQSQQIGQEQQKNIESFMLGAKGLEYNIKINEITEQVSSNTKTQTSINNEFSRAKHLLGNISFEDFLKLKPVPDTEKKIEMVKKDFDKIKNFDLISSKLGHVKELLESYRDFHTAVILKTLSVKSELIGNHFQDHINPSETKQTYSTFLQLGSKLRSRKVTESCPFCTQRIGAGVSKTFLDTVDLVYNENYRNLQKSLKEAGELFDEETFSRELKKVTTDLGHAGHAVGIDFDEFIKEIKNCAKEIQSKKEDLSTTVNETIFEKTKEEAEKHIRTIEAELAGFKNPVEKKNELDKTYYGLLAVRERFGPWKDRADAYLKAKTENKTLGAEKTRLWDEYLLYAKSLSTAMLEDINLVLKECGCDFSVQNFNFKGNQRQDLLVLVMGDEEILNDGEDNEMTIKNSLSESDKWVLALAFFLSAVKNDPTIKVVVMDDPVSSFDSERKRTILREIKRVTQASDKQLIVLTHEGGFYQLLKKEKFEDTALLKIVFDSKDGSDIVPCDPETEVDFISPFHSWVYEMKDAAHSNDLSIVKKAHACIRQVIEHVLKVKYHLELTSAERTVEAMLSKLEEPGGSYQSTSRRSSLEKILTNLTHHDNSGPDQYPEEQLGINDYKKDIRDAFEVIKTL